MYLLISPEISEEDYKIIKEHGLNADSSVFQSYRLKQRKMKTLRLLLGSRQQKTGN